MDEDLRAMAQIRDALAGLDQKALARVLGWAARWAADAHGISIQVEASNQAASDGGVDEDESSGSEERDFDTIADLYDAARPALETDKVLVAGYWLHQFQGQETLDAQQVNTELKHLGHASKNITRAFGALIDQKPQLAVQIRKSGSTQQARKRYKITAAGLHKVEEMLGGRRATEE